MLLALTAYFWVTALLNVISWAQSLIKTPTVKTVIDKPLAESERLVAQGCLGAILLPLVSLLSAPLVYLQAVGLNDLGLPGGVAWLAFGLGLLSAIVAVFKKQVASGYATAFPAIGLLIAWHGLQVLHP